METTGKRPTDMNMLRRGQLTSLQNYIHWMNVEAGWWDNTDIDSVTPTKLCLIHSEISEALEGHRKNLRDDKLTHRSALEVELADAVIRIFDLAGAHELDIGGALFEKMEYNKTREDHKKDVRFKAGGKRY